MRCCKSRYYSDLQLAGTSKNFLKGSFSRFPIEKISKEFKVSPGNLFGGSDADLALEELLKKFQANLMTFFANELNRTSTMQTNQLINFITPVQLTCQLIKQP